MPCATRRCGASASRSTSPSIALPLAGNAPMRARRNVVLPAPLRPMRPHIWPSSSASEASRTIGTGPIATLSPATLSIGRLGDRLGLGAADEGPHPRIGERHGGRAVRDHGAVIEGEHALGEAADDLHVVLDEHDRDLAT